MHNYENIMASILVGSQFHIEKEVYQKVFSSFKGVAHRMEYVKEVNGRYFYNDSKSTNNQATITALSSFDTPVILLMGGYDRHLSFDELKDYMKHVKQIVCFGETKQVIQEFADRNEIPCMVFDTLKEATMYAYTNSKEKDTILLSPACASWDQYTCFEERGEEFKRVIETL